MIHHGSFHMTCARAAGNGPAGLTCAPHGAELPASDDLSRHQEALDAVSVFAAQLHEHMQICTDGQAGTHDPQVSQACCDVAGVHVLTALLSNNPPCPFLSSSLFAATL